MEGAGFGMQLHREAIAVSDDTALLCAHFGINPLSLISSGCLVAMVDPAHVDAAVAAVQAVGVACSIIGTVTEDKCVIIDGELLQQPETDALWGVLGSVAES